MYVCVGMYLTLVLASLVLPGVRPASDNWLSLAREPLDNLARQKYVWAADHGGNSG